MALFLVFNTHICTTAHFYCSGHFTNINACRVWEARARIQVSKKEFHTYIHLDYVRIKILSCIKNNNNNTHICLWNDR